MGHGSFIPDCGRPVKPPSTEIDMPVFRWTALPRPKRADLLPGAAQFALQLSSRPAGPYGRSSAR